MKRIIFIAALSLLIFSTTAYARTYKIVTLPWAGWSPLNVAEVKGFWKEQGIDVKVFSAPTVQDVFNLIKEKRADLGFDAIGSIAGLYMDGNPVVIVAETDWSHGGDKIIVKKDTDITGLKGKPIGVYSNVPSVTFFLNKYLSQNSLKLSDTKIIEMELDVLANNFIEGRFGIIVCYDPEALRAEKQGNGKIVATTASYQGCLPEGIMALEDVLKTIPHDDLVKILKAWIKAAKWTLDLANWK